MPETGGLDRECQLPRLRLDSTLRPDCPAVGDSVPACEPRNLGPERFRLLLAEIGAAAIELLVPSELLRPVARQVLEEMLSRSRPEEEEVRPDPARAGLARRAHDLRKLLRTVGDPGQHRRHADAGTNARVDA